ncbi:sugar phosphate isomerase/epimerase [Telmatocola sphagniphila]|uniref:Sugar phosphate isomerase/epimerase n=1 Tax=Telmatocola sphagniphila TaxID=1123043 RepID=A0A8E6BAC8_9BACT|nr:TIM barrel protein [Telmatocola sphagniphila]QVL34696.1 sugar phosphate isomerase/epimerase [Telmatocola sphagniphila]
MATFPRRQFLAGSAALAGGSLLPHPARSEEPASPPALFKLGMVTYNVAANWDLPTILKVCKNVGIAAVECRTTHKHGVEPSLTALERLTVKKQFADSGIVFWGCGSVCEFHSDKESVVQKNIEDCKNFLKLVADIGGHGVKVRPNGLRKDIPAEKTLEQIGKALIPCGKAAGDLGLEIWVEVHGKDTQEPVNIKKIMEFCNLSNVGVTWNSNATDIKNASISASFDLLKPWIKSCHINEIYNDSLGKYPYRELFRKFREMKYDRYTMIEVARTPVDVASGEDMLRYYKALWTELVRA